jgi:hypothetical protein
MTVSRSTTVSALLASAAAAVPLDRAVAQFAPATPGTMTYSFEGGFAFSNLSTTNFPAGAVPFIPQSFDIFGNAPISGLPPQASGTSGNGWQDGGYGSFSVTRNFDAANDWRFSVGFYLFGTKDRSATASQEFTELFFDAVNTASVTERDRFQLYTADFDFGRNFTAGIFQVRAFAGLRGAYVGDKYDSAIHMVGNDKLGAATLTTVTDTLAYGRASFYGVGPRVGFEYFTGSVWGLVGNLSGAVLGGYRDVTVTSFTYTSVNGAAPTVTSTQLIQNAFSYVANMSGSLGVAWQFAPNGQLVVGYKLDQWWNVRSNFSFVGLDRREDILIQTPFVKATFRF